MIDKIMKFNKGDTIKIAISALDITRVGNDIDVITKNEEKVVIIISEEISGVDLLEKYKGQTIDAYTKLDSLRTGYIIDPLNTNSPTTRTYIRLYSWYQIMMGDKKYWVRKKDIMSRKKESEGYETRDV